MKQEFSRSALVLGEAAVDRLAACRVAVFGVGGVGGYAAEALARGGVGALDLFDSDEVSVSNRNRQIIALGTTVGRKKVDVMRERILDINPDCAVRTDDRFYLPGEGEPIDFSVYDFVVDAIDTVGGKLGLVLACREAGVPIVSAMGAGNKLDPSRFRVSDISKTSVCPLCRVMRIELRRRGVTSLPVVWSDEVPRDPDPAVWAKWGEAGGPGRHIPGSVSFVPGAAGLVLAGYVIRRLSGVPADGEVFPEGGRG